MLMLFCEVLVLEGGCRIMDEEILRAGMCKIIDEEILRARVLIVINAKRFLNSDIGVVLPTSCTMNTQQDYPLPHNTPYTLKHNFAVQRIVLLSSLQSITVYRPICLPSIFIRSLSVYSDQQATQDPLV